MSATPLIPEETLERLGALLEARIGLSFPHDMHRELERALVRLAREGGSDNPRAMADEFLRFADDRRRFEDLAARLMVGETYFWG